MNELNDQEKRARIHGLLREINPTYNVIEVEKNLHVQSGEQLDEIINNLKRMNNE